MSLKEMLKKKNENREIELEKEIKSLEEFNKSRIDMFKFLYTRLGIEEFILVLMDYYTCDNKIIDDKILKDIGFLMTLRDAIKPIIKKEDGTHFNAFIETIVKTIHENYIKELRIDCEV